MKKNFFLIIAAALLWIVLLCPHQSLSQEHKYPLIIKSQYFSVYADHDLDINELLLKLNYDYFLRVDSLSDLTGQDPQSMLAKTLDALYLEASDILGIHIYSYHGNIVLTSNQDSINRIYQKFSPKKFSERSFYLHDKNTIYISYPDLTLGMMGHEISHAILSHYFVVPSSPEVQEILSGYVEYKLRKSTHTLP